MKAGRYKWLLLGLLSCAFFFHQADRALFGLLTIPIQNELHLTDGQIGWINTVLSWTLAAMTMVAGFAGDQHDQCAQEVETGKRGEPGSGTAERILHTHYHKRECYKFNK